MTIHNGNLGLLANSGDLESMSQMMNEMMPYRFGGGGFFWQAHWLLGLITWILLIGLLIALIRWVWRKGNK